MNKNVILNRIELVERKIRILKDNLISAPDGVLYVKHDDEQIRYYFRQSNLFESKYLSIKSDLKLIKKLLNRKYSLQALKAAEEELKLLRRLHKHELDNPLSGIYDKFDEAVKPFINPVEISIDEKIRLFKQRIPKDQFIRTGQYVIKTTRGEYVKSMAEYMIAEAFLKYEVPYLYEDKFKTIDNQIYKPDFTAINLKTGKILLWEHFGMMENQQYVENNIMKLESYRLSGYYPGNGLIITISTKQHPLENKTVDYIVRHSFQK